MLCQSKTEKLPLKRFSNWVVCILAKLSIALVCIQMNYIYSE